MKKGSIAHTSLQFFSIKIEDPKQESIKQQIKKGASPIHIEASTLAPKDPHKPSAPGTQAKQQPQPKPCCLCELKMLVLYTQEDAGLDLCSHLHSSNPLPKFGWKSVQR